MKFQYKEKYAGLSPVQIRNAIRLESSRNPVKFAAIQARAERVELPDGRMKTFIRCCHCEGLFTRAEVQAHHVAPVGRLESTSEEDVIAFGEKVFTKRAGFQALCVPCHQTETRMQRGSVSHQEKYVH